MDRLKKILTTLLIDYSEEQILEALEAIPDAYKKENRKHFERVSETHRVIIQPKNRPAIDEKRDNSKQARPNHRYGVYPW